MFGRILGAVGVSMALAVLVACGGGGSSTPTPTGSGTGVTGTPINLPPADAVVIFGSPETTKDAIEQVQAADGPTNLFAGGESRDETAFDGLDLAGASVLGTTLLRPASADFDAAYEATFGEAPSAPGVREAYDAVYVSALAAVAANSADAKDVRGTLFYVANSPGQIANPGSDGFAAARSVLEVGGDVNYIGVSGQVDLTTQGDISKGQLEVWRLFGGQVLGQEFRDVDLVAEIGADVPAGELKKADGTPQDPLRIGAILPLTGADSDQGTAIQNAMQMAIDEINTSGGVFGSDVELMAEDDAGDSAQAVSAAESLASDGAAVILGLPAEATAQAVADEYANPTSVPVLTLSAAASLPIDANEGFWRLAPSSLLETPVLANLAVEANLESACVLYEGNSDDQALAEAFKAAFEYKQGGVRALVEMTSETDLQACLGT